MGWHTYYLTLAYFLKVLPPIQTNETDTTVEQLMEKTHTVMSDALASMDSIPSDITLSKQLKQH